MGVVGLDCSRLYLRETRRSGEPLYLSAAGYGNVDSAMTPHASQPSPDISPQGGHKAFLAGLEAAGFSPEDIFRIDMAYDLAKSAHARAAPREGGGRYFEHIRSVTNILIDEAGCRDPNTIIAAILHDVVEDTWLFGSTEVYGPAAREVSRQRITHIFGAEVAAIVDAVTKPVEKSPQAHHAYVQGILETGEKAVLVKMADRLHNLRTLGATSREKQARKIAETEAEYLPMFEEAVARWGDSQPGLRVLLTGIEQQLALLKSDTSESFPPACRQIAGD